MTTQHWAHCLFPLTRLENLVILGIVLNTQKHLSLAEGDHYP